MHFFKNATAVTHNYIDKHIKTKNIPCLTFPKVSSSIASGCIMSWRKHAAGMAFSAATNKTIRHLLTFLQSWKRIQRWYNLLLSVLHRKFHERVSRLCLPFLVNCSFGPKKFNPLGYMKYLSMLTSCTSCNIWLGPHTPLTPAKVIPNALIDSVESTE